MRIGLLCLRYGWGGAGNHVESLSKELAKLGHEVRILAGATRPAMDEENGGLEVLDFGLTFENGSPSRWSRRLRRSLRRSLSRGPVDLDIINGNPVSGDFVKGAKRLGIPYVSTLHGSLVSMRRIENNVSAGDGWLLRQIDNFYKLRDSQIERRDYLESDGVVTVSDGVAEEYEAEYGHRVRRYVVPPCPRTEFFEATSRRERDPQPLPVRLPDRFILFIGSTLPRKGLQYLLRAVKHLRQQGTRLTTVIATGGTASSARALVEGAGVSDRTILLDRIPWNHLRELMRRALVLAVPSLYEGLPLTVIEAMSQGLPAVGFDTTGVRDAIDHRRSGFVVRLGDIEALASRLAQIASDAGLRNQMSRKSEEIARRHYSPSKIGRAYAQIYASLT